MNLFRKRLLFFSDLNLITVSHFTSLYMPWPEHDKWSYLNLRFFFCQKTLLIWMNFKGSFTLAKVSVIMRATVARDSNTRQSLLTCLGHLGWCNTDRIVSIYVAMPKVAKPSTMVTVLCHCRQHYCRLYHTNFRQWKDGLSHHLSQLMSLCLSLACVKHKLIIPGVSVTRKKVL